MIKQFYFKQFSLVLVICLNVKVHSLNVKQFYLSQSEATTPGQSGLGTDGKEWILRIPQSSSITEASPSDCLVSYSGHSLWVRSYPFAEM